MQDETKEAVDDPVEAEEAQMDVDVLEEVDRDFSDCDVWSEYIVVLHFAIFSSVFTFLLWAYFW